jgi:hypothetical protein
MGSLINTNTILPTLLLSGCFDSASPVKTEPNFTSEKTSVIPELPAPHYHVQNGALFQDEQEIQLHGLNRSGFEGPSQVVDGLWEHSADDLITKIQTMGFNIKMYDEGEKKFQKVSQISRVEFVRLF